MKKVINFLGEKFVYEGDLNNELPNGYGVLKNTKGILYQGNFKEGNFHGYGIYSGPQTLRDIIYEFIYFEYSSKVYSNDHYRVVGQFKNNKLHGNHIKIFTSNGDFYTGSYINGIPNKKYIFTGWIALDEGKNFSFLDLRNSRNPADYDFKNIDKVKYKLFVESYEDQFKKHGWFPKDLCKDKIEFELKLIQWKKNLNEFEK